MGLVYLIVGLSMVAATAVLVAASLRLPRATDFLLTAYVVASAEMAVVALGLSPTSSLTRSGLLLASVGVLAAAAGVWLARGRPAPPSFRPAIRALRDALRDPVLLVLAATVLGVLVYAGALAVATPPNNYDALWYHLARAAFWKQQHAVGYIAGANDLRLNVFPPVAEISSAWAMILDGTERYASIFQLGSLVAMLVAVAGIARRIGIESGRAVFGALLFASLPVVALQAATPLNDVMVASFLVISAYFLVSDGRASLPIGALSLALAIGTKGTALLALPLLFVVAAALCPRRRLPLAIAAGLAGIVAGSFWYAVNLAEKGNAIPRFAPQNEKHVEAAAAIRIPAQLARLTIDAVDPAGSVGRDRFLYVLAAVVVVAIGAVVASRRRTRGALVGATIAGVLVLVPLAFGPLHDLFLRGYEHTLVSLDRPGLAFLGSDRDAEPPSPFISWYGPLGVLLVLASIPLVVREIRARRLRRGALVLPLAPVLFLVLIVLGIAYSPFHGRYLMPAVALAAATWGLVDTVRPLAWAAGAVAVVTLVLSVVHYEEKPAGFSILGSHAPRSIWSESRLEALAASNAPGGGGAVRVLDDEAARGATVALRIRQDDVSYPFFGADLDRRIELLDATHGLRGGEDWLVIAPGLSVATCKRGWKEIPVLDAGWRVYRRVGACPGESASS
jgi:hypothetical protein